MHSATSRDRSSRSPGSGAFREFWAGPSTKSSLSLGADALVLRDPAWRAEGCDAEDGSVLALRWK